MAVEANEHKAATSATKSVSTPGASGGGDVSGKRIMVGANVVIGIALAVVLVGVLQYAAYKVGGKTDWTRTGINSLSDGTRGVLNSLDKPVTITSTYFKVSPEGEDQPKFRQTVQDLLSLFQSQNRSNVEIDYLNPFEDHKKREELLTRLRDKPKFHDQAKGHIEAVDKFRNELLPQITQVLNGEMAFLSSQGDSLTGGGGGSLLQQVERLLTLWQEDLKTTQEEVDVALAADVPDYGSAISLIKSIYRGVNKALKDVGSVGQQAANSRPSNLTDEQVDFLAGAQERYNDLINELDAQDTSLNELPSLDLEDLVRQLGPQSNAIVVETEDDARVISFADVWPPLNQNDPSRSMAFKDRMFRGEQKLASAVLRLTSDEHTAVIFTRHGGQSLLTPGFVPGQPPGQAPYGEVKLYLEDLNFDVYEWDLAASTTLPEMDPEPARKIFIVFKPQQPNPMTQQQNPQPPFGEQQKQALFDAMGDDGRAMFVIGWSPGMFGMMPSEYEFSDYLSEQWGIEVDPGVLLLKAAPIGPGKFAFSRNLLMMVELGFGGSPIVASMSGLRTALPMCCPISRSDNTPEGVSLDRLIWCPQSEGLWGVKDVQKYQEQMSNEYIIKAEGDLEGEFTVAMAGTKGDSKIVAVSSRDFFSDQMAFAREMVLTSQGLSLRSVSPGNISLLANCLHWLNDSTELMNLGRPIEEPTIEVDEETLPVVRAVAYAVWPAVVLACGLAAWFVRRR